MQVVGADESLEAAVALVGPQAGVDAHVVLQVVVVSKSGAALLAQVRLLPGVFPHVNLQLVLPAWERKDREGGRRSAWGSAFVLAPGTGPTIATGLSIAWYEVERHPVLG